MYAIVEYKGKQVQVEEGKMPVFPKIDGNKGMEITFDKVLFYKDDNETLIGKPYLDGIKVIGRYLETTKDQKIIALRYIPRKNRRVKRGHRQDLTKVFIETIRKEG